MRALPDFPRPTPHTFEAGSDGLCLTCGLDCDPYGLRSAPAFPELSQEIPTCPSCTHYQHDRECRVVTSRWEQRICGCHGSAVPA